MRPACCGCCGPPRDNGDALALLGRHVVLEPALAAARRRAVGFRNVLVHEYVEVNDEIVLARLADPSDLERFVRQSPIGSATDAVVHSLGATGS